MPSPQGTMLTMVIGRFHWQQREYELARTFLFLACKSGGNLGRLVEIQLATMLDPFPNSTSVTDDAVLALHVDSAERHLQEHPYPQHPQLELELDKHALSAIGAANDPHVHCMLSIFHVNVSHMANLRYRIATRVWPALSHESKFIHKQRRPNKVKKIKLGIASGILSPGSSVTSDFSGV
jgi:hypothetical protein